LTRKFHVSSARIYSDEFGLLPTYIFVTFDSADRRERR
jgi:hypothetical protein